MRIVVDMDQVICQWLERTLEWWNQDKKTSVTVQDVKAWNVTDTLGPASIDFIRSVMRYPEFYRDLEPVPGAIEGMKRLIELKHDVIIATAVPKSAGIAYHGKMEWLRRNMPFFPLENMVAIHRKELIKGDVLLDDGLHNIEPWRAAGGRAIIFDCPWNQGTDGERVKSWNEFLELIETEAVK